MKPVYQVPMDGQCMRASICSIFELPIEAGPKVTCEGQGYDPEQKIFVCKIPEHKYLSYTDGKGVEHFRYHCDSGNEQDKWINEWAQQFGLVWVGVYMEHGNREVGIRPSTRYKCLPAGLCVATGPSPRGDFHHGVVWDTRPIDFEHPYGRMVHDPNPDPEGKRPGIEHVNQFHWFDVEDPSKLHLLAEFRQRYIQQTP
jgi:hypothetical protein